MPCPLPTYDSSRTGLPSEHDSFCCFLNSTPLVASSILSLKNILSLGKRDAPCSVFPAPRIYTGHGFLPVASRSEPSVFVQFFCLGPCWYILRGTKGGTPWADLCNGTSYSTLCPLAPPSKQAIPGLMRVYQFTLELGQ